MQHAVYFYKISSKLIVAKKCEEREREKGVSHKYDTM